MSRILTYAGRFVVLQMCGSVPFALMIFGYVSPETALSWVMLMFMTGAFLSYKKLTKPIEVIEP